MKNSFSMENERSWAQSPKDLFYLIVICWKNGTHSIIYEPLQFTNYYYYFMTDAICSRNTGNTSQISHTHRRQHRYENEIVKLMCLKTALESSRKWLTIEDWSHSLPYAIHSRSTFHAPLNVVTEHYIPIYLTFTCVPYCIWNSIG